MMRGDRFEDERDQAGSGRVDSGESEVMPETPSAEEGIRAFVPNDDVIDAVDVGVILSDEEQERLVRRKQVRVIAGLLGLFVVIAVIVIPVSVTETRKNAMMKRTTASPSLRPSSAPSLAPTVALIPPSIQCLSFLTSSDAFRNRGSAQWKALRWITSADQYVVSQGLRCTDKRYVQRYALATMFYEMNGENWKYCGLNDPECSLNPTQSGWLSNNDVCNWHQVRCDGYNVIALNFGAQFADQRAYTRFIGTFPSEIRYLTDLKQINLKQSGVKGTIPEYFKAMSKLQEFNLWNNQLTGSLPPFLSGDNFPELRILILTNNSLQGEIPTTHGSLKSLREYRFDSNKITGRIPSELANMLNISFLDLGGNRLTGTVPQGIFSRTELRILSLYNNTVAGTLPSDINKLSYLERIKLQFTNFGGQIPSSLFRIPRIQEVNLRSCKFATNISSISRSIANASYLQILDLGMNSISGQIPDIFGDIEYFEELLLDNTNLTGSISQKVCSKQGTDFGQIQTLVVGCNINRPPNCGYCVSA